MLRGTAGTVAPLSTSSPAGNAGLYTSGSCAGGPSGLKTFWPGPRLLFYLDLGDGTPLGGSLTVTTCGLTANNTVLYVGTGCPTWAVPFNCVGGNDDAADAAAGGTTAVGAAVPPACAPGAANANPRASALTIVAQSRAYFLQVGGYGGADVTTGLAWTYRPAPATPSPSRTRSRTRTASRTRSRTPSRSRSRKPK
jgi:hypothetical protein